jgi:hypothetical protein
MARPTSVRHPAMGRPLRLGGPGHPGGMNPFDVLRRADDPRVPGEIQAYMRAPDGSLADHPRTSVYEPVQAAAWTVSEPATEPRSVRVTSLGTTQSYNLLQRRPVDVRYVRRVPTYLDAPERTVAPGTAPRRQRRSAPARAPVGSPSTRLGVLNSTRPATHPQRIRIPDRPTSHGRQSRSGTASVRSCACEWIKAVRAGFYVSRASCADSPGRSTGGQLPRPPDQPDSAIRVYA